MGVTRAGPWDMAGWKEGRGGLWAWSSPPQPPYQGHCALGEPCSFQCPHSPAHPPSHLLPPGNRNLRHHALAIQHGVPQALAPPPGSYHCTSRVWFLQWLAKVKTKGERGKQFLPLFSSYPLSGCSLEVLILRTEAWALFAVSICFLCCGSQVSPRDEERPR